MIPELVIVALEFYREPRRFPHLTDPRYALPAGVTDLLAAPTNVLSDQRIEETAAILNATVNECKEMVPFFIRQALLDSGGDYYRMLGLSRDADANEIKKHYQYLIRLFHPDKDVSDDNWDELYAVGINKAYNTLRNSAKRSEYDHSASAEDNIGFAPASTQPPAARTRNRYNTHTPSTAKVSMSPQAKKLALALVAVVLAGFTLLVIMESRQPTLRVVDESEMPTQSGSLSSPGQADSVTVLLQEREVADLPGDGAQKLDDKNIGKHREELVLHDPGAGENPSTGKVPAMAENETVLSMEEMIRLRVEQATVAVVGQPVATVAVKIPAAKDQKQARPTPEESSVKKIDTHTISTESVAVAQPAAGSPATSVAAGNVPQEQPKLVSPVTLDPAPEKRNQRQNKIKNDSETSSSDVVSSPAARNTATSVAAANTPEEQFKPGSLMPVVTTLEKISEPSKMPANAAQGDNTVGTSISAVDIDAALPVDMKSSNSEPNENVQAPVQPPIKLSQQSTNIVIDQQSAHKTTRADSSSITSEQLLKLLGVFMSSYEAGNLEVFVDLFSEDARTTDGDGKLAIYNLYKEYFAKPEKRRISIDQYRWKDQGTNGKVGSGDVNLVTIPLDGSPQTNGAGSLKLHVQLYPAGLKIKGMFYKIKTR